MDLLKAILGCFPAVGDFSSIHETRYDGYGKLATSEKDEQLAAEIVRVLFTAEKSGQDLKKKLHQFVHTESWTDKLAKCILDKLVDMLNTNAAMGEVMKNAFDEASKKASDFVNEHPIFVAAVVTIVAIGILVLILPWAVEALGFGELGPVEGSFAAWWQSTFPDAEAGSIFSYLQKLGMRWGKS